MNKKTLFLILLTSLLCVSSVFSASYMMVRVNNFSGSTGEVVEAVVEALDADNVGSMDMVIAYDSEILVFNELNKGNLTADSIIDYIQEKGEVKIIINDIEGFSGDGSILNIIFKVIGQAGDNCTISITELEANDATSFVDKLLEVVPGQFKVAENVQGSITCLTSSTEVNLDESLVISGNISPASKNEVTISLRNSNDGLHEVTTTSDEFGNYSVDYSPMVEGDWEVIASWEYESVIIQSSSASFYVQQSQNGGIPGFPVWSILAAVLLYFLVREWGK